jgi:hypothetical protein
MEAHIQPLWWESTQTSSLKPTEIPPNNLLLHMQQKVVGWRSERAPSSPHLSLAHRFEVRPAGRSGPASLVAAMPA